MPNQYAQFHRLSRDPVSAVTEASLLINEAFNGEPADLIFAFAANYAGAEFDLALPKVAQLTDCENVVGLSCSSFVSGDRELENQSGVCLWAARFEQATVSTFHLDFNARGEEHFFSGWPESIDEIWQQNPTLFLLTDPFSFPVDVLLDRLGEDRPGTNIFGGVADGATGPREARLLLGDQAYSDGAVAVTIINIDIHSVVSQGCRPIGEPHIVTSVERNEIQTLRGKPSFEVLKSTYDTLPTQDKAQVEQGLHLGIAMTELKDNFEFGDFLIRNVIGIDEDRNSFTVSDYVRLGKTIQFHIRDAQSASVELELMLGQCAEKLQVTRSAPPNAALIFTCNGRGSWLFAEPDHDAKMIYKTFGELSCAGFFAAGEIGTVGQRAFLHGFTASVAVFPS